MRKIGLLMIAVLLGIGWMGNTAVPTAAAAELTTIVLPTNLAKDGTVTASGENGEHQGRNKAFDQFVFSKWLTFSTPAWLQFDFGEPVTIDGYALTSAKTPNHSPDSDPKSWVLQGSNDLTTWTTLDTKTDQNFRLRHQRKHYLLDNNTTAYR